MIDLVLTLIGPDRPGLVEAIAQTVAARGGNWLESRMIHLAGKFAGILRVEVPLAQADTLARALEALAATGLRVVAESSARLPARTGAVSDSATATASAAAATGDRVMTVELIGLDRPGLVREISQLLARQEINVEELTSDRTSAPMSGEMLFRAHARVKVPGHIDAAHLRASLERLASDLTVEIRLEEGDADGAVPS
jgi:glycine cleavage system regulatory protein